LPLHEQLTGGHQRLGGSMRIVVIGAKGVIGRAVADALAAAGHDVLRASRTSELSVDTQDRDSIAALYKRVGVVDGVVVAAGEGRHLPLTQLSDDDFAFSIRSKLMSQVNVVRLGIDHLRDGGIFVLTAGIYGQKPEPGTATFALVNGGLESFARAAATELPRGIRIAAISPPWIKESAAQVGREGILSAADNAKIYVDVIEGRLAGPVVTTF
jgi:NAD(P)-dependent dehydrogenase (short-subunit alcohol dehydrogenase family)